MSEDNKHDDPIDNTMNIDINNSDNNAVSASRSPSTPRSAIATPRNDVSDPNTLTPDGAVNNPNSASSSQLPPSYDFERTDTLGTFAHPSSTGENTYIQGELALNAVSSMPEAIPMHHSPSQSPTKSVKSNKSKSAITKEIDRDNLFYELNGPCLNPSTEVNARLDSLVEVKVYPCNNSTSERKKKNVTQFNVKPEGVIIQGTNKNRTAHNDLGAEYSNYIGRKLTRWELQDTRACQLLVTSHNKSFWVVPAPEAFSRHSGTCRLLGDRKHTVASHTLQVGDFLRVGSVGVVVIETHNGEENRILSEEKIQKIMKDTTTSNGGFLDLGETDGENSDDSMSQAGSTTKNADGECPVCYMCFDDENTEENPLITPCKCRGDTRYVHVGCLRKWHTAEADNQICFLSSVDATCSVCKTTFKSDFKLKDGRLVKLFKSSLEPPYVSLLIATKHEMAQRLFNTRFQLSFSTIMKPDGKNATRPLLLGRSSGSDMVLDYRTVSARHANIRFKNGEFIFTDAQSSNGSYLYLRRPVELIPNQQVQFRLGRSMISMKVVNKLHKRLFRAVRRTGNAAGASEDVEDHSVGSNEEDVRITDGKTGTFTSYLPRRSRESIIESMPAPGKLRQTSSQHLDLLYALAYPKKTVDSHNHRKRDSSKNIVTEESNVEEINDDVNSLMAAVSISNSRNN